MPIFIMRGGFGHASKIRDYVKEYSFIGQSG